MEHNPKNSQSQNPKESSLVLPPIISTPADISRLIKELEVIDEALLQLSLRSGGEAVKTPKTTCFMDIVVEVNKINLLIEKERIKLKNFLVEVEQKAPQLHFSFSADPSVKFTEKLVIWLREEIHPYIVVTIGLQPSIGAGCYMRGTNKYFDFSLRQTFIEKRGLLKEKLRSSQQTVGETQ